VYVYSSLWAGAAGSLAAKDRVNTYICTYVRLHYSRLLLLWQESRSFWLFLFQETCVHVILLSSSCGVAECGPWRVCCC